MSRPVVFKFRLYIAGDTENSMLAVSNLSSLCRMCLDGRHEIEVVDVILQPKRALEDGILMTPTLVKVSPAPLRRIIGTLNPQEPVLRSLGLESAPYAAGSITAALAGRRVASGG